MKNITVSVDDEVYRTARVSAAHRGTSVSALFREFLVRLNAAEPSKSVADVIEEIVRERRSRGEHLRAADNLSREELHDRELSRK